MILAELYAGTAALSLSYFGLSPYPVRMGNKGRVAPELRKRIGGEIEGLILCEFDPHVRALLHSYFDRDLHEATKKSLVDWIDAEPRALWEACRAQVLEERAKRKAYTLAPWIVAASWAVTKGVKSLSYAGPGKVTATGNRPVCVKDTGRMAARLPYLGDVPHVILPSAEDAEPWLRDGGAVVYADPPYTWDRDGCYGSSSNYATAIELLLRIPCPSWLSSGEPIDTSSETIGDTRMSKVSKPDFLTRIVA